MNAPRLIVHDPSGKTREVVLGTETRIGRLPDSEIALDDPKISRQHAVIRRLANGERILVDLGSTNGTLLNGEPLKMPTRLRSSDVIGLGPFLLSYVEESSALPISTSSVALTKIGMLNAGRDESLIGLGPAMADVFGLLDRAAALDVPVLIEGETGSGKELVARAIHRLSARVDGPFIAAACETLGENDLCEPPAARSGDATLLDSGEGPFAQASRGSLFLDEVSQLPLGVQAKLLRQIDGVPTRRTETAPGVRILSSTNRSLADAIERGTFRKDLYFRLAAFRIVVPPLRERREDIPLLCERLLRAAAERQGKRIRGITPEALELLTTADWPGNVRQLRNEIEAAVAIAGDAQKIDVADLSAARPVPPRPGAPHSARDARDDAASSARPSPPPPTEPDGDAIFRCDGEFWTLRYGGQTILVKDNKGLRLLSCLLAEPWREFHVRELAAELDEAQPGAHERTPRGVEGTGQSAGEAIIALDARAKGEYRRRLAGLREELDDAERDNDPGRAERARTEIEFITQQLSAAVGLGGRDRPIAAHHERARLLVTQRIKAALKKIADSHAPLAQHLQASVRTGYKCSYSPDPEEKIDWRR